MVRTTCDPRALRVAQELHRTEQPEVTILFGSRARGDYQDGQSDIDIMLVQENLPSKEQESRADNMTRTLVKSIYDTHTPVQIVWQTSNEFDRMRRTINHVAAHAVREGIILPRNSEEFDHQHVNEDREYEWSITDERCCDAEENLQAFDNLIQTGSSDNMIGHHAQAALEHALKALISANGQRYSQIHNVQDLTSAALETDSGFQFQLSIDSGIYNQYAGGERYRNTINPISDILDYQELVRNDVQAVLDRVQNVREARSR